MTQIIYGVHDTRGIRVLVDGKEVPFKTIHDGIEFYWPVDDRFHKFEIIYRG